MPGPSKRAVIAGGGIGGLATALALARLGIPSEVCERRAASTEEGAGIQIGPNGSRILRSLGVADFLQERVATPDALSVRDGATGREWTRLPLGSWIEARHGSPYWTAHRGDLHAALRMAAEAQPLIALTRGAEIVAFENTGDSVRVNGASGEIFAGSMLIAADGLWSRLRQQIAGEGIPEAVGKSAFRTVVAANVLPAALTANAVHIWLAPGAHAVHYPVNAGRDIALVIIADDASKEAGWDALAPVEAAREKIRGFAGPLQELVNNAQAWRHWSLFEMPQLSKWTNGRAAVLGDAAHPMLPFFAQGAVMALEDAMTLATHVAKDDDVEAALLGYAGERQARVARVAEASRRNGRIYHFRGAAALARNTAIKLLPPEALMARFDWLYGWTA